MKLSRSEQKRRIKQLEKLVVELADLAPALVNKLPLAPETREEILEVRRLKGGARKRQLKYITRLLRDQPVEPLYDYLARRRGNGLREKKQFHELEYLRDRLIEEAIEARRLARAEHGDLEEGWHSEVAEQIREELPMVDSRALSRLGFFFAMSRNKKHSREIFRLLQAAREQEERRRALDR